MNERHQEEDSRRREMGKRVSKLGGMAGSNYKESSRNDQQNKDNEIHNPFVAATSHEDYGISHGLTLSTQQQNMVVSQIDVREEEQRWGRRRGGEEGDQGDFISQMQNEVQIAKQQLNRLVAQRGDNTVTISEAGNKVFRLNQDIELTLRISCQDKQGPLKIFFKYLEPKIDFQRMKAVVCYYSWDAMEPSETANQGKQVNPKKIEFESTLKVPQKGLDTFEKPYFYLTMVPKINCTLKVTTQFKSCLKKNKDIGKNAGGGLDPAAKGGIMIEEDGSVVGELNFEQGRTMKYNKLKIKTFISKLERDATAKHQLMKVCQQILADRAKERYKMGQKFTSLTVHEVLQQPALPGHQAVQDLRDKISNHVLMYDRLLNNQKKKKLRFQDSEESLDDCDDRGELSDRQK